MSPKKPTKPRSVKRKVTPKAAPAPKKKSPVFHLHARNPMQLAYVEAIRKNDLTFGIGPAGTGKTFLAVALAVESLKAGVVSKLVLVRPAVEAGERLGFLPGSFQEKVDPYMRPIYDALHEIIGPTETEGLINSGVIEIAPLAFMRGRAEPVTNLIPTPDGFVRIGNLKVGDPVFGSDGQPAKVTGVYPQGIKPVVDMVFSDNSVVRCSKDHLWNTRTQTDRNRGAKFKTFTAEEISKSVVDKYNRKLHEIPTVSAPVELHYKPLRMSPYLLGCLLGDGCISCGSIGFTTADQEMVDLVSNELPVGVSIKKNESSATGYDYRITNDTPGGSDNLIKTELGRLGLWGTLSYNKHIPLDYLFNEPIVRLALLQGLMDTDGSVFAQRSGRNRVQFYTTSPRLAGDVKFLVDSLGGVAKIRVRVTAKDGTHTSGFGHNHDAQVVDIALPVGINPFRLKRKAEKFNPIPVLRFVTNVKEAGEEECVCISVDTEDHLYLTNNFIVTHNTLKHAFVIMDEAQNTTSEQMLMLLTRFGKGFKAVVNGDLKQIDLPNKAKSGLIEARKKLANLDGIEFVFFTDADVVRHPIVQKIVQAYEEEE